MKLIQAFNGPRGATTVELLGAALSAMVMLSGLYAFYRDQLLYLVVQETKTATLEDARGALDIMVRELKNAGSFPILPVTTCVKDAAGNPLRIVSAAANSINIQTDIRSPGTTNPDGNCTEPDESVTYDIGKPTDTCSGPQIIRRNSVCLLANVVVSAAEPLFSYFDVNDAPLPANPPADAIKRVRIKFAVEVPDPTPQGKSAGKTIRSTLTSSVEIRNPPGPAL